MISLVMLNDTRQNKIVRSVDNNRMAKYPQSNGSVELISQHPISSSCLASPVFVDQLFEWHAQRLAPPSAIAVHDDRMAN